MADKELRLKAASRTYIMPGGERYTVTSPRKLVVKDSGTHHIVDAMGRRHVINKAWLAFTE